MTLHLAFFLAACRAALAGPVSVEAVPKSEFTFTAENVCGLSGLTWCRDDLYCAVSDRLQAIVPLRITLDPATGSIIAVKENAMVPVKTMLEDFEDIAWDAASNQAFISTEKPAAIIGFALNGKPGPMVSLPGVFLKARRNLGLESLTKNAALARAWTANEDALPADGAVSSPDSGALIRLQEFDAGWKPLRQFAWRTERSSARFRGSGTGVSGLCLLDDGSLLVMERVMIGATLEVRVFLADCTGATATAMLPGLSGVVLTPARKHLLYRKSSGLTNWEGLAAGPRLEDGSRSLILIADSGKGNVHSLLALKVGSEKERSGKN